MPDEPPRPRTVTAAPVPPIDRVLAIVSAIPAKIEAQRDEAERAHETALAVLRELQALRRAVDPTRTIFIPPIPPVSTPPLSNGAGHPERPSLAVQSKRGAVKLGKVGPWVVGVLSIAGQLAALARPEYVGPLTAILRALGGLVGVEPGVEAPLP